MISLVFFKFLKMLYSIGPNPQSSLVLVTVTLKIAFLRMEGVTVGATVSLVVGGRDVAGMVGIFLDMPLDVVGLITGSDVSRMIGPLLHV